MSGGKLLPWHIKAKHDFEHSGDSIGEIAARYGRTRSTITKLMQRERDSGREWVRKAPPTHLGGRKRQDEQKILSPEHLAIGIRLNHYRTIENDFTLTRVGDVLICSRFMVRHMELGLHDFSLREIRAIADLVQVPVSELLKPARPNA